MRIRKMASETILPHIYTKEHREGSRPVFDGKLEYMQGEGQIAIALPPIQIRGKKRRFLVKITKHPAPRKYGKLPNGHVVLSPAFKLSAQEGLAIFLGRKGLQTPCHHAIALGDTHRTATIVEDLRQHGNVSEAETFDFDSVPNGQKLRQKFQEHVSRLREMEKEKMVSPERHRENVEKPHERTFLVVHHPGTKRHAALVAGDLDNLLLTERHSDSDHRIARGIQDTIWEEFMKQHSGRGKPKKSIRFGKIE